MYTHTKSYSNTCVSQVYYRHTHSVSLSLSLSHPTNLPGYSSERFLCNPTWYCLGALQSSNEYIQTKCMCVCMCTFRWDSYEPSISNLIYFEIYRGILWTYWLYAFKQSSDMHKCKRTLLYIYSSIFTSVCVADMYEDVDIWPVCMYRILCILLFCLPGSVASCPQYGFHLAHVPIHAHGLTMIRNKVKGTNTDTGTHIHTRTAAPFLRIAKSRKPISHPVLSFFDCTLRSAARTTVTNLVNTLWRIHTTM